MLKEPPCKGGSLRGATLVAAHCCVADYGDGECVLEALYRDRHGRWLLYGEGGPKSPYGRPAGLGVRVAGCEVRALDEQQAVRWLASMGHDEQHLRLAV